MSRPDIVITGNHHDEWGHGAPNQADHIALGRAVLDGARDAGNRWVFRDLDLEPAHVDTVLVAASPDAEHGVDVTNHLDAGVASLTAHVAYLRGLGDGAMRSPRDFLEGMARRVGEQLGVRFGVAFEVVRF